MKYASKPPVWFFFAKEETEIDFVKLQEVMMKYDPVTVLQLMLVMCIHTLCFILAQTFLLELLFF